MQGANPTAIGDGRQLQRWAAALAMTIGALTLVGLASGLDQLTRWIPTLTSMNPVVAVLLLVGGMSLLAPDFTQRWAFPVAGLLIVTVGALKLGQTILGYSLDFDEIVAAALKQAHLPLPSPIALNTAAACILLGAALAIGRTKRSRLAIMAQIFAIAAIATAVMALAGLALGSVAINHLTFNRMAVNTAVALTAFGVAILALTPAHGLMKLMLHDGPSGNLARKALPICLAVPILLGVARLNLEQSIDLATGDGVAIMVAGNIALTLSLMWGCLILLQRSDAELRAKAKALAASQDQYRQASRIGKMGHWQFDVVRSQLLWTDEFRALLKLPADMLPNLEAMNGSIHPDDRAAAQGMMERARTRGENWNWQIRLLSVDGDMQYFQSHGICRRAPDGSLDSILGVLADVTELEVARQGAEAASIAQANFLANMSHEIRTPLNGVLGFIDLVLDSELDQTQRRYLVLVRESAQVLLKLLNDILDLSKVEAGHVDIALQATDLRRTIRHAARLMLPIAEQKSLELSIELAPDFPAAVMIDGGRVRQILLNLLGNALKFTDTGGVKVSLAVGQIDGSPAIQLAVTDTGVGIPAERKDAVFAAFVQADSSTSRRFGGSGLGLSISRQLAQLMDGSIALDSEPGVGTTVTLSLPLVPAATAQIVASEQAESSGRHGSVLGVIDSDSTPTDLLLAPTGPGRSILLVDDVAFNRELVSEMLRRLGHSVECANDGAQALAMAERLASDPDAWDLILMDIQMPVMNGKDATRAIRGLGGAAAAIPIIALSANAFQAEIEQSREAGMNDHVVKPIDFSLLGRTIDRWTAAHGLSAPAKRHA